MGMTRVPVFPLRPLLIFRGVHMAALPANPYGQRAQKRRHAVKKENPPSKHVELSSCGCRVCEHWRRHGGGFNACTLLEDRALVFLSGFPSFPNRLASFGRGRQEVFEYIAMKCKNVSSVKRMRRFGARGLSHSEFYPVDILRRLICFCCIWSFSFFAS